LLFFYYEVDIIKVFECIVSWFLENDLYFISLRFFFAAAELACDVKNRFLLREEFAHGIKCMFMMKILIRNFQTLKSNNENDLQESNVGWVFVVVEKEES
jgi:hypothetical protein